MDMDLGGVQIRVSQPLLELEGGDPLLGFVGRERMPEGMTGGLLGNPRFLAILCPFRTLFWNSEAILLEVLKSGEAELATDAFIPPNHLFL